MILGMNSNDKERRKLIDDCVGKPFSLMERIKKGGIGSRRMLIESASGEFEKCFGYNNDLKYANIELRPKGILIYIKNKVNDYVWVVPYYQLVIFQNRFFSLHANGLKIQFNMKSVYPANRQFIKKMLLSKNQLCEGGSL